ncbi:MAG: ATP-binding protein [Lachnospiraceae bacterium]|nr:ATP-binding protein [Lachnospiraceae bacterium]
MKEFNTTAVCIPQKHYMVDLTERVKQIKTMVDAGKYFTINRGRQYGKTTTLFALKQYLKKEYVVLSLDFQSLGYDSFQDEADFSAAMAQIILDLVDFSGFYVPEDVAEALQGLVGQERSSVRMYSLFRIFRKWIAASEKPIVLMIDEVDSASNNQVFLDFLAQLREGYIRRDTEDAPAFQSVIFAGVTDIRHLKSKIRDEAQHRVNSPWNIAADFLVRMEFSTEEIAGMLSEYETDHRTGMELTAIAQSIEDYTSGYPFLVSRICQLIDLYWEDMGFSSLSGAWTLVGIDEAVKRLLCERNTLFESLTGKLVNYPELRETLRKILMEGDTASYNPDQEELRQMEMYGFIRSQNGKAVIVNRVFETRLYNLFLSDEELQNSEFANEGAAQKNIFIHDGQLDMSLILERFIDTYHKVFGPLKGKFKEKDGRELFLLYLRPIINGTGNYYIEAQTRDQTRTDVVVDYLGKQYIIELKIWRGERYNAKGERQISEYLDYFGLRKGYMLSFNFNKNKETGVRRVEIGGKTLIEGTV